MPNNDVREDPCFTFIWKIENFSHCTQRQGEELDSPTFTVKTLGDSSWYLSLYPREEENPIAVGFYLYRVGCKKEPESIEIDYELAFLGADSSLLSRSGVETYEFKREDNQGCSPFVTRNELYDRKSEYLPSDTLTARCLLWKKDKELQQTGICHARTRIEVERGTFTWTIQDFSDLRHNEKRKNMRLRACSKNIPPTVLSLHLDDASTEKKYRLQAIQVNTKHQNILSFKMSVRGSGSKRIDFAKDEYIFEKTKEIQVGIFQSLVSVTDLIAQKDDYVPKHVLTLECDIAMSSGVLSNEIENIKYNPLPYLSINPIITRLAPDFDPRQDPEPSCSIKTDLQSLFSEGFLYDVHLRADGKKFSAHKIILGARSPVFRAMFTGEMKEKTSDFVDISDLEADTIRHMLTYIYSDTVEDLQWNNMCQLYVAADKYQVSSLKLRCSDFLKNKISRSNACDLLVLSEMHLDTDLKSFVQDFISQNDVEVMETDEWEKIEKDNPQLALETCKYVLFKIK